MQCLYVFVKWLEDPTKWNVVPVKHVKSKGELKTGQAVEVKWGSAYHRAPLIDIGKCRLVFDSPVIESIGLNQTKFVESKRFDSPSGLFDSQAVIESNALEIRVD